ncbi:MAG: phytanoyl-CoA dioxygenase family protein [Candidatus Latescibacteria bacterium]|nr:phytanoyl-CoA dioxygenase family protein [Candidatus Latescibacterota bacterium]
MEPDCLAQVQRACESLVEGLAQQLLAQGKIAQSYAAAPFDQRLLLLYRDLPDETPRIFRPELHLSGFFGLFAHPRLLAAAEQVLGPEIRLYPNYSVRPKLPRDPRTEVLWHQDAGYTPGEAQVLRMVNVWTPLVPARVENGCMQFVPGSHRQGVVAHERDLHYLRLADAVIQPLEAQAVSIEVDPGDVVFFSNLLFHRGLPNQADHVRWSLDFRYQDATQSTLRAAQGHLLRSPSRPDLVVRDTEHWTQLKFQ